MNKRTLQDWAGGCGVVTIVAFVGALGGAGFSVVFRQPLAECVLIGAMGFLVVAAVVINRWLLRK